MKIIRNAWRRWLILRQGSPWAGPTHPASRSGDRLFFAMLATAATWVGSEYIVTAPQRAFYPYGGSYIAGYILVTLLACYAAARIVNRALAFPRYAAVFFVGQAIIIGMFVVVTKSMPGPAPGQVADLTSPEIVIFVELAALAITAYVAAAYTLHIGRIAPIFLTLLPIAAMAVYSQIPRLPIWYTVQPQQAAANDTEQISVDWTYYDQSSLMTRSLNGLAKPRPGVTDLYFIGFAGYAPQDVFLKEVKAARQLFDSRFDTTERSMLLINNRATVKETPLANGHNLWHALRDIGERIDRDEDVVFLFLTSHGAQNLLSVDFWPLQPDNLVPDDLRTMFDKAGIKWRVIVVSACYSGSFIDELRDDNTLIITAAHADKTSFGCSNENEFTYFGRAYFDQALRGTFSFIDAFEKASYIIAERERAELLTPSEPQIDIGKAIKGKLRTLQKELSARHKAQIANAKAPPPRADNLPQDKTK